MVKILSLTICLVVLIANINALKDPLMTDGRSVLIHLFEWKWNEYFI
jgi:hypothetical protein